MGGKAAVQSRLDFLLQCADQLAHGNVTYIDQLVPGNIT